jgi:hypothetical protein
VAITTANTQDDAESDMILTEKIAKLRTEIADIRKQYESLGKQIVLKSKQLENMLIKLNKDRFTDIAWLMQNPNMPGAHEATKDMIVGLYGTEYNGPQPSGYIRIDEKNVVCQKNFEFCFTQYGKETNHREMVKKNCDHFIETFLPHLAPVMEADGGGQETFPDIKVVPFNFQSESHGLDYLGYEPTEGVWYYFTMVYRRTEIVKKFKSWDEAFDFAYAMVNESSETDDDDRW